MSFQDSDAVDRFFRTGLKLSHLKTVVRLGELGQVTRVAAAFNVTQPAISKQIGEIEEALGVSVVRRVGNAVELTRVGQVIAARGHEILKQIEFARRDVSALASGTAGHVRFGSVVTIPETLAPGAVRLFMHRAPNASLSFMEGTLDHLIRLLDEGQLDLAVGRNRIPDQPSLACETLQSEPFVFVAGTTHELGATNTAVSWDDMQQVRWITPLRSSPAYATLAETLASQNISLDRVSVESSSLSMNLSLLKSGDFVSILPISIARHHVSRGRMRVLPLPPLEPLAEIVLYWRTESTTQAAKLFCDCLREVSADL
jgi:DNA-binding transcriptional LysR family regulator